jgi:hypothetical protein
VEKHTGHETRWIVLYVKRWLAAPVQHPDGTLQGVRLFSRWDKSASPWRRDHAAAGSGWQ